MKPATPTDGAYIAVDLMATTVGEDLVHRSNKTYTYRLFACEDSSCSSWYGDSSGGSLEGSTNTDVTTATEMEKWELTGLYDGTYVTTVAIDDPDANAPHAFIYPTDWGSGLSDTMALYYSTDNSAGPPSKIWYTIHEGSGWPTNLNDPDSWTTPTLVAVGSTDDTEADYRADHPWAMLTLDGTDKRIQLFVHSQFTLESTHKEIIQIESLDEVGDNFNLNCDQVEEDCDTFLTGDGYLAIEADGTSSTDFVNKAQHSRIYWDYVAEPYIEAGTHEPFMMFQMKRPTSGECLDSGLYDDIGRADGSWNSTYGLWEWDVDVNGDAPYCPEVHVSDVHDNTMIPLPNNEFRMYFQKYSDSQYYVVYWNGSSWEDETQIDFFWQDDTVDGPGHDCIQNVAAIIRPEGTGNPDEAMVFRLMDSTSGADCPSGDGLHLTGEVDNAIVFAELKN